MFGELNYRTYKGATRLKLKTELNAGNKKIVRNKRSFKII